MGPKKEIKINARGKMDVTKSQTTDTTVCLTPEPEACLPSLCVGKEVRSGLERL